VVKASRRPAVAGSFYPADPRRLEATIDRLLAAAESRPGPPPLAMIQPHAGYEYSGPVAATGYRRLGETRPSVRRVVILAPNHTAPLDTMAISTADAWETPIGEVVVDDDLRAALAGLNHTEIDEVPHRREHAVEVHLPFLQRVLDPNWALLPVVVGAVPDEAVAALIDRGSEDGDTLIVASSDLSHYLPYDEARHRDERTVARIVAGDRTGIGPDDACGRHPVRGLLAARCLESRHAEVLDVRNSGDTAGGRDAVVGYASIVFC